MSPHQWITASWGYGASVAGDQDGMSFHLGAVQWLVLTTAAASVVFDLKRRAPTARTWYFVCWGTVITLAMFLMTEAAVGVWESLPPLRFAQFPWRFLMVTAVASAAIAARVLAMVPDANVRAALLLCAVIVQVQLSHQRMQPVGYYPETEMRIDHPHWRFTEDARKRAFLEAGYYPVTAHPDPHRELGRWTVLRGHATVRALSLKGHDVILEVESDEAIDLRITRTRFLAGPCVSTDAPRSACQIVRI